MNKILSHPYSVSLLAVFIGSMAAWWLLGRPLTGIDDADIFLVYARHFADGSGFVYNAGGERVEGFTSMLWTLLCAGLLRMTDRIEVSLFLLNLLLGSVAVWACLRRTDRPGLFLVLLASVPAWFAWCQVTLMESGLWCLLLTLLVLAVIDGRTVMVFLLLPLLVIARPESMLWGGWLLLMLGVRHAGQQGWRMAAMRTALPGIAFAATLAGLVAFRLAYFGYPVPNTYYAKVSPSFLHNLWMGGGYLLGYLLSNPAVMLVSLIWGSTMVRGLRDRQQGLSDPGVLLAGCLLPGFIIPVLVGGDHFSGFRFYQPVWPLLCLGAAREWPRLAERFPRIRPRILLPLLLAAGWLLFPLVVRMRHEFDIARDGRATGAALAQMFSDLETYPTVATITAGGRKYAYPGTVHDLMGLNSTVMAHAPGPRTGYKNHTAFNRDIFYAWHPDIVLCGTDPAFDARVLRGLFSEERFRERYQMLSLQRNGREVRAYYAHAFLEQVHQTAP